MEAAGSGNYVQQRQSPVRRSFGWRFVECRSYRDSSAVRVLSVRVCSLYSVSVWSSKSPTTNKVTI